MLCWQSPVLDPGVEVTSLCGSYCRHLFNDYTPGMLIVSMNYDCCVANFDHRH